MTDQIVRLNIGGYKYQTTRTTLASNGENFFTKLLEGKIGSVKDEQGNYFIDRDGQYFQPILSFLRTGLLTLPEGMPIDLVDLEADFYLIDIHPQTKLPKSVPLSHNTSLYFNGIYWYSKKTTSAALLKPDSTIQFYGLFDSQRTEYKLVNETTLEVEVSNRNLNDTVKYWLVTLVSGESIACNSGFGRWTTMNFLPSLPPITGFFYSGSTGFGSLKFSFTNEDTIIIKHYSAPKTGFPPVEPAKKITAGGVIKYLFTLDQQFKECEGSYAIYSFGVLLLVKNQAKSALTKQFYTVNDEK